MLMAGKLQMVDPATERACEVATDQPGRHDFVSQVTRQPPSATTTSTRATSDSTSCCHSYSALTLATDQGLSKEFQHTRPAGPLPKMNTATKNPAAVACRLSDSVHASSAAY